MYGMVWYGMVVAELVYTETVGPIIGVGLTILFWWLLFRRYSHVLKPQRNLIFIMLVVASWLPELLCYLKFKEVHLSRSASK
jgi:hypothetical protein